MDLCEFESFLSDNGLNESSINKLVSEEINDFATLSILSEEDVEELGLKMGQRAKLRKIITEAENRVSEHKDNHSQRTKNKNWPEDKKARTEDKRVRIEDKNVDDNRPKPQPRSRTAIEDGKSKRVTRTTPEESSESSSDSDGEIRRGDRKHYTFSKSKSSEVALDYHCLKSEDKGKVVIDLSTEHQDEIDPLPAKILLLVDVSGSMGIKLGRSRKHSKLSKMRKFAEMMLHSLDDGDFISLVTFGQDAKVLLPLKEINSKTKDDVLQMITQLDKTYLSTKTNLSAGLSTAIDVLHGSTTRQEDLLNYRNAIVVFSDGEINEGTTQPGKLVHEVREKIRNLSYGMDDSQNQWVSISTIATGNEVSEAMFMLSKFCSSEAFYHLDVEKANAEVELFLPILLRKSAVAWNVSLYVESLNGATIINEETTQEHKIRLRENTRDGQRCKKAFLYYDIPVASNKHIGIAINMKDVVTNPKTEVLSLSVSYTGLSRKRRTFTKIICRNDFEDTDAAKRASAIAANMKHDARLISQNALQRAADHVKDGNARASSADILDGQNDLQRLLDKYGKMAETAEDETVDVRPQIVSYADILMKNMGNLLDGLTSEKQDEEPDTKQWMKIKAMTSAISRESPTISSTVTDTDVLAPLPNLKRISGNIQFQFENLYKEQGVRNSRFMGPTLETVRE